jgi:tripartite-type tricarboxylate transporter receptor subunit TctC
MMMRYLARALLFGSLAGAVFALPAHAQIGAEPIRIIFPFAAGGSGDALARLLAEHLRTTLNTGAQGRLGVQAVKAAAPDGKTLLLTPVAPMSVYQHVYKSLAYDPIADFQPLSQIATFDFAFAVGPQVPAKSLKELVDWVKANPAEGSYGIPAAGSLPHFFGVLFAKTAGLDLRHVGYRGSAARSSTSSPGSCLSSSSLRRTCLNSTRRNASACLPPLTGSARRFCPTFQPSRKRATT